MIWVVGAVVLLALCAAFVIGLQVSRGRMMVAILAPAAVMAAFGAFAGSAAAALATAADPASGLWRGALGGCALGMAVGGVLALLVTVWRRLRRT